MTFFPLKSIPYQVAKHQNPLDFTEKKPDDLNGLNPSSLTVFKVPKCSSDWVISYFMEIL